MEGNIKEFGGDLISIFDNQTMIESAEEDFIKKILLTHIKPRKDQPRKTFSDESLNELAASIKIKGVLQPIIVSKMANDHFEIIVGERRWRAAQLAGLTTIPAIIKDYDRKDIMSVSLIENIQRENLNSIEEAMAIQQLIEEFSMTHHSVADAIGKSRTTITNLLRLLGLQDEVKVMLKNGLLDMGHARALLALPDNQQLAVAEKIVKRQLSVRETEKLVNRYKITTQEPNIVEQPHQQKTDYLSQLLSAHLSAKVKIQFNNNGKGKVIIHVNSLNEVEGLVDRLHLS